MRVDFGSFQACVEFLAEVVFEFVRTGYDSFVSEIWFLSSSGAQVGWH